MDAAPRARRHRHAEAARPGAPRSGEPVGADASGRHARRAGRAAPRLLRGRAASARARDHRERDDARPTPRTRRRRRLARARRRRVDRRLRHRLLVARLPARSRDRHAEARQVFRARPRDARAESRDRRLDRAPRSCAEARDRRRGRRDGLVPRLSRGSRIRHRTRLLFQPAVARGRLLRVDRGTQRRGAPPRRLNRRSKRRTTRNDVTNVATVHKSSPPPPPPPLAARASTRTVRVTGTAALPALSFAVYVTTYVPITLVSTGLSTLGVNGPSTSSMAVAPGST